MRVLARARCDRRSLCSSALLPPALSQRCGQSVRVRDQRVSNNAGGGDRSFENFNIGAADSAYLNLHEGFPGAYPGNFPFVLENLAISNLNHNLRLHGISEFTWITSGTGTDLCL